MDTDQRLHDIPDGASRSTDASPLLTPDDVRRQHERVIARFFDGRRLTVLPSKRKSQLEVLLELASWFTPGAVYDEVQVNAVLREAHDDVAALRRALVDAGYMVRDHGQYRLASSAPERPSHLGVLGHEVGDTRLMGVAPPSAVWWRSVLYCSTQAARAVVRSVLLAYMQA